MKLLAKLACILLGMPKQPCDKFDLMVKFRVQMFEETENLSEYFFT